MDRAVKALPEFKRYETEIVDLKAKMKTELADADANTRDKKEKETQATTTKRYKGMVEKIAAAVRDVGGSAG